MKIKYVLHNMNPLKRDMMDGDLKSYVSQKRLKMSESLEKLKSNKGLKKAIVNKLMKYGAGITSMEEFIDAMNLASDKGKGLYDYSLKVNKDDTILIMEVGDMYFVVDGMIKSTLPRFHRKSHDNTDISRDAWLKWFEKELTKYHDRENWERTILEDRLSKVKSFDDIG